MAFAEDFWELVLKANSIAITSHKSPDDDSIAAVLAINWLVKEKYPEKRLEMLYPGSADMNRYNNFAHFTEIKFVDQVLAELAGFDLILFVDAGRWDRFGDKEKNKIDAATKLVGIDHHSGEDIPFVLKDIDTTSVSATEIIAFDLVGEIKGRDHELLRILLMGVLGDSGDLKFVKPTQGRVFQLVRDLLQELDTSIQEFTTSYSAVSTRVFEIVKMLVANTRFVEAEGKWPAYQVAYLDKEVRRLQGYSDVEISSARNFYTDSYFTHVGSYELLFVYIPRGEKDYYVSLRSVSKAVSVRKLAEGLGGGGHDVSAAITFQASPGEEVERIDVMDRVKDWMRKHEPEA